MNKKMMNTIFSVTFFLIFMKYVYFILPYLFLSSYRG